MCITFLIPSYYISPLKFDEIVLYDNSTIIKVIRSSWVKLQTEDCWSPAAFQAGVDRRCTINPQIRYQAVCLSVCNLIPVLCALCPSRTREFQVP